VTNFVARYLGSTATHPGIEHFEAESKAEVLRKAREVEERTGLELALISLTEEGGQQVWNAQRAARPERNGNGWLEDRLELFLPQGFPEE
jgi:hypothetical protein